MRTTIVVFLKEILDNLRDRRTLASALIMGPLFGPMLFAFVINLSIERSLDDVQRIIELPVGSSGFGRTRSSTIGRCKSVTVTPKSDSNCSSDP